MKRWRRSKAKSLLALALCGAWLLAGCDLFAPPPEPTPPAKAWVLSAGGTRLSRFEAGDLAVVWSYNLNLAFYRRGDEQAAGEYEGRLTLRLESECYQNGVYTPAPEGLEDAGLGGEAWLLSEMMTLQIAEADGGLENVAAAMAHDEAARNALGLAAQPDADWLQEEGTPARAALFDCDDFGNKLPASQGAEIKWRSGMAALRWEDASPAWTWERFAQSARLVQVAGGFEGQPVAEEPYAPGWASVFGAWPEDGTDGLPLWVDIAADGTAYVYIAGLVPLEAGRPFTGALTSGTSVAASLPTPPSQPEEDSSLPPEPDSSEAESKPIWPPPDSGTDDSDSTSQPDSEPEEEEPDPLEEALTEYGLPYPPPGATITGPTAKDGVLRFDIAGFDYQDAAGYARKLKMGGYKNVLGEVEQPILDVYSLSARNGVGRQVTLNYDNGETYMLAM